MSDQKPQPTQQPDRTFHVMCKPAGPRCNLRCRYCFYTEKAALFEEGTRRMSDEVLEAYVRKYIEAEPGPEVNFAWQGGEPTLMGVDFFRRAVELQKQYRGNKRISNSFQTNGILIDEEWAEFLSGQNFLVGLSLDGPPEIHNRYRIDAGGEPTFDKVENALRTLQRHDVRVNVLSSVTAESAEHPLEIYKFYKDIGVAFIQFIPIVERVPDEESRRLGLQLAEPRLGTSAESTEVMPWSVGPEQYGDFLIAIFDRWVRRDVGSIFVQLFDICLAAWVGQEPPLCNFARTCGNAMIIEHNGDLYSCDHFVYPDHRLGNIIEDPVEEMVNHPAVRRLGEFKWEGLPAQCRDCEVLFICHGGCPKNRFAKTEDGGPGLNYLCTGYRKFFRHINPKMKRMAELLRQQRAPAEIMDDSPSSGTPGKRITLPGMRNARRNEPCPCGSGRKYKHCCGRRR